MNWGWHRQKEVLKTDKATQAESRLAAIKKVRENLRRGDKQRRDCCAKQKRRYLTLPLSSFGGGDILEMSFRSSKPLLSMSVSASRIKQGMHHARAGPFSVRGILRFNS